MNTIKYLQFLRCTIGDKSIIANSINFDFRYLLFLNSSLGLYIIFILDIHSVISTL